MIRESRYLVIKKKDLAAIYDTDCLNPELAPLTNILKQLPNRQFVVVESDWPEYETVWSMIEQRVDSENSIHS